MREKSVRIINKVKVKISSLQIMFRDRLKKKESNVENQNRADIFFCPV